MENGVGNAERNAAVAVRRASENSIYILEVLSSSYFIFRGVNYCQLLCQRRPPSIFIVLSWLAVSCCGGLLFVAHDAPCIVRIRGVFTRAL